MKTIEEIAAIMKANSEKIAEIEKSLKEMPWKDRELSNLAEEEIQLEVENRIWKDNARRVVFDYTVKNLVEVLEKYNGKPYGEKTKEKICQEMIDRCNIAVYLSESEYRNMASFTPLNSKGYSGTMFNYDDFDVYGEMRGTDRKRVKVLIANKIQALNEDDFYLSNCPAYVENVTERAETILKGFESLKVKKEEFERKCSEFNNLLPSSIIDKSTRNFTNYLF